MTVIGFLTPEEHSHLVVFERDNFLEDDRNHSGTQRYNFKTTGYELDPKIAKAVKLGHKLNELGRLTSDDIVEIACLPEPEVPGSQFNAIARRKLSDFLLDVHNRVKGHGRVYH